MRGKSEDFYKNKFKKLMMPFIWRNKVFLDGRREGKRATRFDTVCGLHFGNMYFRDIGDIPISA
jgi:hypothetical protein